MALNLSYSKTSEDEDLKREKEWQEIVARVDKTPNGVSDERLTLSEIETKYPNQWVGLSDIEYEDNDGINIATAVVNFINRDRGDLSVLQELGLTKAWYTAPEGLEVLDAWC